MSTTHRRVNWVPFRKPACAFFCALVVYWPALPAPACPVPVFRYALERWEDAPYQVFVLHQQSLDKDAAAAVKVLSDAASRQPLYANAVTTVVDLSAASVSAMFRKLWETQGSPGKPWMVVKRPPPGSRWDTYSSPDPEQAELLSEGDVVYAGPVTVQAANSLLDSPARREIARRILKGDSAVWVLLESGSHQSDEATAKLLADTLAQLERSLELPEALEQELDGYLSPGGPELKISFSVLRVSRDDPGERFLASIALKMVEGSAEAIGPIEVQSPKSKIQNPKSIVVPVFGRGRALTALYGDQLTAQTIANVAEFLVGNCTCDIGYARPGVELLMSAGWENFIVGRYAVDEALPSLTLPSPAGRGSPGRGRDLLLRNIVVLVVIAGAAIAAATVAMMRRRPAAKP